MLFNSLDFAIFMAILLPLYFATGRKWRLQNLVLLTAGYVFYGWWDIRFLGLLVASTLADYSAGLVMGHAKNEKVRKTAFVLVLVFNLGLLGVFKYFNFFAESFAASTQAMFGWQPGWTTLNVILPVGISFYTFQSIGYSIDVYRRLIPATRDLLSYSAFVAFFPQLVAGPIERAGHLLRQMAGPRTPTAAGVWLGICDFVWGLFKKIVVADYLAPHADSVFMNLSGHRPSTVVAATVVFAIQIYCDFSAYSDMARGLARILGFDLVKNFATPYFATSPQDFWHRWHMSLSGWFRDYLYFPLGGSRKGEPRTHLNTMTVFLVSGLWHGAAWTYVLWGGLHGLGLSIQRVLTRANLTPFPKNERINGFLGWAVTFVFVCIGWYLFRAPSVSEAFAGVKTLLTKHPEGSLAKHGFGGSGTRIGILLALDWISRKNGFAAWVVERRLVWQVLILAALLFAMALFTTKKGVQFIYFQF